MEDCRIYNAFRQGQQTHVEDEVLWREDGTYFQAEYWSYPERRNGVILGAVVTFLDITERKRTAELLAMQKRRLSDIIEGTHVGTWEWNILTGEKIYNERWTEIVGYTLEELAPITFDTWDNLVHPDDMLRANDLLKKHLNKESEFYECECTSAP